MRARIDRDSEIAAIPDIMARIGDLWASLAVALEMAGPTPKTLVVFEALDARVKIGWTAAIKITEQLEDQLARLFRSILVVNDVDLTGMYARDIANSMEQQGIIADAARWTEIVRLRNRLVHDYPLTAEARFKALQEVIGAHAVLRAATDGAIVYLSQRGGS